MKANKVSRSTPTTKPAPLPPTHEQIEALAHAIWIDRGQPEGRDLDNWLEAERELKGDVRTPLAADDIPADNQALEPDATLEGKAERELDEITAPRIPRSPTSL
jgi:hypothetical protein